MLKVVLDTNVLVSGLRSRTGASFRLLEALGRVLTPQLSVPLVLEYEDVLARGLAGSNWSAEQLAAVVDYLCTVGESQEIYYLWRPCLRDPKDDMLLELAVAAGVRWIVTHNLRDFSGTERFGVEAISPQTCLRMLEMKS